MKAQILDWPCTLTVHSNKGAMSRRHNRSFEIKATRKDAPRKILEELKRCVHKIPLKDFFFVFISVPPIEQIPTNGRLLLRVRTSMANRGILDAQDPKDVFVRGYGPKQAELLRT